MAMVVDASVAMGWVVPSQATRLAESALTVVTEDTGWVPAHFGIEMARGLRTRERRSLLTSERVDVALRTLRALPLRQDGVAALDLIETIVVLARRQSVRIADAGYLELALRMNLPLATQDAALALAAMRTGATLFTV
jgi:predicted nucleic acid-binding protein